MCRGVHYISHIIVCFITNSLSGLGHTQLNIEDFFTRAVFHRKILVRIHSLRQMLRMFLHTLALQLLLIHENTTQDLRMEMDIAALDINAFKRSAVVLCP